jgi:pyruvate kinase
LSYLYILVTITDVTNAVYDGADAVMTSGETAKGKYPHETITFMNEIILSAERYSVNGALGRPAQTAFSSSPRTYESAVAKAAVAATEERPTAAILVGVKIGGSLPRLVAAYRPNVPIFAFCPTAKMGRLLQLHRGVHPIVSESAVEPADEPQSAIRLLKELGHVQSGDEVVLLAMGDDESLGRMATLKLATVN